LASIRITHNTQTFYISYRIKESFAVPAQEIIELTYLCPFDGSKKTDLYQLAIERFTHGAQHAARVAVYII
jgi:hypothetical protein